MTMLLDTDDQAESDEWADIWASDPAGGQVPPRVAVRNGNFGKRGLTVKSTSGVSCIVIER